MCLANGDYEMRGKWNLMESAETEKNGKFETPLSFLAFYSFHFLSFFLYFFLVALLLRVLDLSNCVEWTCCVVDVCLGACKPARVDYSYFAEG